MTTDDDSLISTLSEQHRKKVSSDNESVVIIATDDVPPPQPGYMIKMMAVGDKKEPNKIKQFSFAAKLLSSGYDKGPNTIQTEMDTGVVFMISFLSTIQPNIQCQFHTLESFN